MNAFTPLPAPGTVIDNAIPPEQDPLSPAYGFTPTRWDGWTPERQKRFVQAISEGYTIKQACRIVGLSPQSAYAFRRRPQGASFALAWQAACLLVRDELAEELLDRARNGYVETVTYRDGTSAERHRHDNRFALTVLNRLDRLADRASGDVSLAAARLVAAEFDQFVELLGQGPARAGVFLGARAAEAGEGDLAPIRALARADRWLRTHSSLAEEVDTADLDPARRSEWTAGQWARAEAAGLVALAPPPPAQDPDSSKVDQPIDHEEDFGSPVWRDERLGEWRTRYPAPPGFLGDEDGAYGDEDYSRELTPEEVEAIEAPRRAELAERARVEAAERDALFGFVPAAAPAPAQADEAGEAWDEGPFADDGDPLGDDDDENWDYANDAAVISGEMTLDEDEPDQ